MNPIRLNLKYYEQSSVSQYSQYRPSVFIRVITHPQPHSNKNYMSKQTAKRTRETFPGGFSFATSTDLEFLK